MYSFSKPPRPVVSVYSGFFSGGARNVHTDVISNLQEHGMPQVAVSLRSIVDRGSEGLQRMEDDRNYKTLTSQGVTVHSLGLNEHEEVVTPRNIAAMAEILTFLNPQAVMSLKEQPVELLVEANKYLERRGRQSYPIIITLHRTDPEVQDPETMETLKALEDDRKSRKFIKGYLGCAESTVHAYAKALDLEHEKSQKFAFISNGIDLDMFTPSSEENVRGFIDQYIGADAGVTPQTPLVAIGARNSKEKNIGLFLKSAVDFLQRSDDAHVVMCGSGMTEDKLKAQIEFAMLGASMTEEQMENVRSRIHPIGPIPREDMAVLATAADVVSLTSPTLGEADPLVLKEGMACGAIPVSTCTGDMPRVVGLNNPKEYFLSEIPNGFVVGDRGIVTSQRPADIAHAWQHALGHQDEFVHNIVRYRPELAKSNMIEGYMTALERGFFMGPIMPKTVRAQVAGYGIYTPDF